MAWCGAVWGLWRGWEVNTARHPPWHLRPRGGPPQQQRRGPLGPVVGASAHNQQTSVSEPDTCTLRYIWDGEGANGAGCGSDGWGRGCCRRRGPSPPATTATAAATATDPAAAELYPSNSKRRRKATASYSAQHLPIWVRERFSPPQDASP